MLKLLFYGLLLLIPLAFIWNLWHGSSQPSRPNIHSVDAIAELFPKTKKTLEAQVSQAIAQAKKSLDQIYVVVDNKRTFNNTMRAYDITAQNLSTVHSVMNLLKLASPDEELRDAAAKASVELQAFSIDNFSMNPRLYKAVEAYNHKLGDSAFAQKESLNDVEKYFLSETLKEFKKSGLQLPVETQDKIKELQKEIAQKSTDFDQNIASANRSIEVSAEELKGLPDSFIKSLKKTESGKFILTTDWPVVQTVLEECSVAETRKKLMREFVRRGYPANEQILSSVITLREKLAHLLGYASYAHLDIDDQMAKKPEVVQMFLEDIRKRATIKAEKEFTQLKQHLPQGVHLSNDGRLYPWDYMYVRNHFKKINLNVNELAIQEYFPLDYTLPALLSIYEKFFGIIFKAVDGPELWHKDVKWMAVYKDGQYVGTVLLDLFPRPFKYTHAAQLTVVPAVKTPSKTLSSVVFVIANFPPAQENKPVLLKRNDVIVFFHEFGHAIHSLLGATELAGFSGTAVKTDFVEMPSQMLEEWMWQPEILKLVSSHYKTKKPLPDDLIEQILLLKNDTSGYDTARQTAYATISLNYFMPGATKNVKKIWKDAFESILGNYLVFDDENHGYANFGHLMGYGSKYYGYLWSKVFALDLFSKIKSEGLLDRSVGEHYTRQVIGLGGSKDPELMLEAFLGRKPNSDAFFKDLGI